MPRGKKGVTNKKKEPEPKRICTSCGGEQFEAKYYMTESFLYKHYKRMAVCKLCIKKMYDMIFSKTNNHKVTMYRLCRKLDIPFRHVLYEMADKDVNRGKAKEIYAVYITKMNSLGSCNGYLGDFDDSDELDAGKNRNTSDVDDMSKEILGEFQITPEIVIFWGVGLDVYDYWVLEETYNSYLNSYEIDSKTLEELVKQICFQHLIINKKRAGMESVDKDLKTLQELMASCNLKPVQETGMNSVEQATFGTLIKKWENEEPIPEPAPEWRDVNKIQKYIKTWFTGHLSKMMGVETGITEEYKEEIEQFTVEEGDN